MASINDSIGSNNYLTATTKRLIAQGLWGPEPAVKQYSNGEPSEQMNLDAYFRFYTTSCVRAVHGSGGYMSDQTHQQILNIAHHLRNGDPRDSIRRSLSHLSRECVDGSINLAAQLLLMLKFTSSRFTISGTEQLSWTSDSAIAVSISEYFLPKQETEGEVVSLESSFTGYNIEKIAGIEIFWTDNLADHLRLMEDDTKVAIFHHVTFLECQLK
ncbi:hypothetical protein FE257_005117 [Aspergillus nanangensis]|uniref:Uncharacterized protein n=1 Tax=Aspergillus nanangensis TaxID=2582783 RepID=A0AAD4CAD9_ASPNN|nr:hypothetical protein FE257_005117 [Aspergillus nanangensis]